MAMSHAGLVSRLAPKTACPTTPLCQTVIILLHLTIRDVPWNQTHGIHAPRIVVVTSLGNKSRCPGRSVLTATSPLPAPARSPKRKLGNILFRFRLGLGIGSSLSRSEVFLFIHQDLDSAGNQTVVTVQVGVSTRHADWRWWREAA